MSNWTNATVIVKTADQATAQKLSPDCEKAFVTAASATGKLPATHYFTCGPWFNDTLDTLANQKQFDRAIIFGDNPQDALEKASLQQIVAPE